MGRRASLLVKEKGVFGVGLVVDWCLGKRSYLFRTAAAPKTRRPDCTSSFSLSSCRLTISMPNNHPFLKPFSRLKKAITRSRSPMPQSADVTSHDLARPISDPPTLITPSLTIHAADIALPVTSKILFNLPAPKCTLITH